MSAKTFVYVSQPAEQVIRIFQLDPADGKLLEVEQLSIGASSGSLCVDPQKEFLFASLRSNSTIASFQRDRSTGRLKPINVAKLPEGENAAYVALDRTGRYLISASYAAGKVVVHGVGPGGQIQSPSLQTITTERTAHCVTFDLENRFVFVPHVAPNAVFQFRFDPATGKLTDVGRAAGGAPKAGPRHLAFHHSGKYAFSSDEQGSSVTLYQVRDGGGLAPVQTLSTLPADFQGTNSTAEVKVHPSGNFVWVSNRGHDSLAGFRFDLASARLTAIGQAPTEKTPRSFEVEPDGQYVFGGGEGSGGLAVYRVNKETGQLQRLHSYPCGKSVSWVMAVKD